MKHFDINWSDFLAVLPKWQTLHTTARRCFLTQIKSKAQVHADQLDESAAPLLKAGFLIPSPKLHGRVELNPAFNQFRRAMSAMSRHLLFDNENPQIILQAYISEHFTHEQRHHMFDRYAHSAQATDIVTSVDWIGDFRALDIKGITDWERRHDDHHRHKPQFLTPDSGRTAQKVLKRLIEQNGPIEFSRLGELFPKTHSVTWYTVIPACLRYMLLFAALRKADLEPMLGVWPPIVRRFNRPAPKLPPLLKPAETFQADLLVQDMTTILSLCHANPMRVRTNDYEIFSKARTLIEDHLVTLPEWLTSLNYYPLPERTNLALHALHDLRFTSVKGQAGRNYRMEIPKKGLEWLALTAAQRAKSIFDLLAKHQGSLTSNGRGQLVWLPVGNRFWLDEQPKNDIKAALDRALLQLGTDGFRDLSDFITYQSIEANPLKEGESAEELRRAVLGWNYRQRSEDHLENTWKEFLFNYIVRRLAVLGGIELGTTRDKQICLALTPWGQYHLGLTDEFRIPEQKAQDVIVQPNFEVVFLGHSASAEAEIGRFSERVGKGAGTLFKITKASILHAAEVGLTTEKVLSTLEKISTKSIPPNISREITGWFASCRQIRVKSTILIKCPDEETAMKIQSLGKRDVTSITSRILEVSSPQAKKTLIGKLRKQGIFLT